MLNIMLSSLVTRTNPALYPQIPAEFSPSPDFRQSQKIYVTLKLTDQLQNIK